MIFKNLKQALTSSTFEEHTTRGVLKCKNKRCEIWNTITEENSYIFEKENSIHHE